MKNKDRVSSCYREGTKDWEHQYDMLLDDNVTCEKCHWISRCEDLFGQNPKDTSCQFFPNRFHENVPYVWDA